MLRKFFAPLTVAFAGIWGCSWPSSAPTPPVVLAQLSDAGQHPQAEALTLKGVPRIEWVGEHKWGYHKPNGKKREPLFVMWVVPLQEEGQDPSSVVHVWVRNASTNDAGGTSEDWLSSLQEGFGTSAQTLKVISRPDDADSGWRKAIQDAEQRHGVRSAPSATVVLWPPEN